MEYFGRKLFPRVWPKPLLTTQRIWTAHTYKQRWGFPINGKYVIMCAILKMENMVKIVWPLSVLSSMFSCLSFFHLSFVALTPSSSCLASLSSLSAHTFSQFQIGVEKLTLFMFTHAQFNLSGCQVWYFGRWQNKSNFSSVGCVQSLSYQWGNLNAI